jgi:hypothetical protein
MATIIVAALAGLAGVVLGGILQVEASRRALLRDKQLSAATDFSAAAVGVFMVLDREMHRRGKPPADRAGQADWLAQLKAGLEVVRDEVRALMSIAGRVEMLFGVGSPTAQAANDLVVHLSQMLDATGGDDVKAVTREYEAGADMLETVHRAAHRVFARAVWDPRQTVKTDKTS